MSERRFASGGVIQPSAQEPETVKVLVSGGLFSFDGERGPWVEILNPSEILDLAKELR